MATVDREAPVEFLRTAFAAHDWVAVFLKSYATGQVAQRPPALSAQVPNLLTDGWLLTHGFVADSPTTISKKHVSPRLSGRLQVL